MVLKYKNLLFSIVKKLNCVALMGTKCIVNETAFYNTSYESKASIL